MVILGSCYMSLPGYDRIGGVNSSGGPPKWLEALNSGRSS